MKLDTAAKVMNWLINEYPQRGPTPEMHATAERLALAVRVLELVEKRANSAFNGSRACQGILAEAAKEEGK